jgi:hypothetical protein
VQHFLLVDDSGECVISPEGAEVLYAPTHSWESPEERYTESLLLPDDKLYAIGELITTGSGPLETHESADVSHLLAGWKKDRLELLRRFDANRDGTVDLQEWERARVEATETVRKQHAALRAADAVHLLRKPGGRRLFILAAGSPDRLVRRFAVWALLHLVIVFAAGSTAVLLLA